MTLAELLGSFGDKRTDPLLSDPVSALAADPFDGDPQPWPSWYNDEPAQATGETAFGDNHALEPLSTDSVFFDGTPAVPSHETTCRDPAGHLGLPRRPTPGVQFSTVIGREQIGELNESLKQGWRISHAVALRCSVDVLIVLEFEARRPGADTPPPMASLHDAHPAHRDAAATETPTGDGSLPSLPALDSRPQQPAWVATPTDRPQPLPDWTSGH